MRRINNTVYAFSFAVVAGAILAEVMAYDGSTQLYYPTRRGCKRRACTTVLVVQVKQTGPTIKGAEKLWRDLKRLCFADEKLLPFWDVHGIMDGTEFPAYLRCGCTRKRTRKSCNDDNDNDNEPCPTSHRARESSTGARDPGTFLAPSKGSLCV